MLKQKSWIAAGLVATMALSVGITLGVEPSPAKASGDVITIAPPSLPVVGSANALNIAVSGFTGTNFQANVGLFTPSGDPVTNGVFTVPANKQSGLTALFGFPQNYSGSSLGFSGARDAVVGALEAITWTPASQQSNLQIRVTVMPQLGTNQYFNEVNGRYYEYVPQSGIHWATARTDASAKRLFGADGLRGYLAHVTTAQENEFIANNVDAESIWIGATDQESEGFWRWQGTTVAGVTIGTQRAGATFEGSNELGFLFDRYPNKSSLSDANGDFNITGDFVPAAGYRDWPLTVRGVPANNPLLRAGWVPKREPNNSGGSEHCAATNFRFGGTTDPVDYLGRWNDFNCTTSNVSGYLVEYGGRSDDPTNLSLGTVTQSVSTAAFTVPSAPTIGTITGGNGTLQVAFTQSSTGGSDIIRYEYSTNNGTTFISVPDNQLSSPITLTAQSTGGALVNNTTYQVRLRAVNGVGTSSQSTAVSGTPLPNVPDAPVLTSITAGNQQITVTFTQGDDGGATITSYEYATNGSTFRALPDIPSAGSVTITSESVETGGAFAPLANGTIYTIALRARNSAGPSLSSNTLTAKPVTVPSAPTIDRIAAGNRQLSVEFTAGDDGGSPITTYMYSIDDGPFRLLDTEQTSSPIVITTLSIDGTTLLDNGTPYSVRLQAVTNVGESPPSGAVSGTPVTIPSAPTITAITPGNRQLTVEFDAADAGGSTVSNYEYSTDGGISFRPFPTPRTSSPVTITVLSSDGLTQLDNGEEYAVLLKAVTAVDLVSEASNSLTGTPRRAPDAPSVDNVVPGDRQITVTFSPGDDGGSEITIFEYSLNDGPFQVFTVAEMESSITVTFSTLSSDITAPLVNGTEYSVRIRAVNAAGPSDASNSLAATPRGTPDAPTVTAVVAGDQELTVSLTLGSDGGFPIDLLEYSTDGGVTFAEVTDGPGVTTFTIDGVSDDPDIPLVNGTPYTVVVRVTNSVGLVSDASEARQATPRTLPGAPTISQVVPGNRQLTLTITEGDNGGASLTGFEYSINGAAFLPLTAQPGGATTTATVTVLSADGVTRLSNGITYQVRVRAVNEAGPSGASAAVPGTPFTAPAPPTITGIIAGDRQLAVSFTLGDSGGFPITSVEFSTDGTTFRALTPAQVSSPLVITSLSTGVGSDALVNGNRYTITLRAVTSGGVSAASAGVGATPAAPAPPTARTQRPPAPNQTLTETPAGQSPAQLPPGRTPAPGTAPAPLAGPLPSIGGSGAGVPSVPTALIGGRLTPVNTTVMSPNQATLQTGSTSFGVGIAEGQGTISSQGGNTELSVQAGSQTRLSGSGLFPGSTVQVFMPLGANSSREIAQLPVDPSGSFDGDAVFTTRPQDPPLPIGRHTLQIASLNDAGERVIVEMAINIAQPPPAPQTLREDGTIPGMQPGQSLATQAGVPVDVSLRVNPDTGQTLVEGDGWTFSVNLGDDSSSVEETPDGGALLSVVRGGTATITGNGFMPLSRADVWLFSDPTLLGTINIDENGEFNGEVSIDGRVIPVGDHTLQLQGVGVDGFILAANLGVVVTDPVESAQAATSDASATLLWWIVALIALLVVVGLVWWAIRRRARVS